MRVQENQLYRVLILGDFAYGESYTSSGARILQDKGYQYSTEKLVPFVQATDYFITNLETPLALKDEFPSPFEGGKSWIHWADPVASGEALVKLGVNAVSLANNHTTDLGPAGLTETLAVLQQLGIDAFGAGPTSREANAPLRVPLPDHVGGGEIDFYGSFQYSTRTDRLYQSYATKSRPGCARISARIIPSPAAQKKRVDTFNIAFPHWGANYRWKSAGQELISRGLVEKGYDLILGHGGHCLQEIESTDDIWTVYGIGNGHFLSGGRWEENKQSANILPHSFWAILEVSLKGGASRSVDLCLYPIYSDNRFTNFQPGPVSEQDFEHIIEELSERSNHQLFTSCPSLNIGKDYLGHYIRIELGKWPLGGAPEAYPTATTEERDSGPTQLTQGTTKPIHESSATSAEDMLRQSASINDFGSNPLLSLPKSSVEGASIEAASLSYGLTVKRFNGALFTASDQEGNTIGFRRSWSTLSSVVGSEACTDKAVCKAMLNMAGVPTAVAKKMPRRGTRSASKFVAQYGWPVVVKPLKGSGGRGVTANIRNHRQLRAAIREADSTNGFLIERHVPGEDYRFLVLGNEVVGVWRRDAANITGDGTSSVSELIDKKNAIRSRNPHLFTRLIQKDSLVRNHLANDGRDLDYIPNLNEKVYLRSAANLSSGGDNIEVTNETHPSLKEVAVRARRALPGIELVGVDLLISDHRLHAQDQIVNVCEVNSQPGITAHDYPMYGPPRTVASKYVERTAQLLSVKLSDVRSHDRFSMAIIGTFDSDTFIDFVYEVEANLDLELEATKMARDLLILELHGDPLSIAALDCLIVSPPPRVGQVESTLIQRLFD